MSMTQAPLTAKWKAFTLTENYHLHQASTEIQGEFSHLQLWRVLLGLYWSSPSLTASRSPLALKDVKCCSIWDISFWTGLFKYILVSRWEQTSKPRCGSYYERNLCKKLGGRLHISCVSVGFVQGCFRATMLWRCSSKEHSTCSSFVVSSAGMHNNDIYPLLAYPLQKISFPEFTLPILFIKLSFLIYSDEAVRMTLMDVCRYLKCTHFKHCSWEEWVVTFRHGMKNNMPGPNVKYNHGWY